MPSTIKDDYITLLSEDNTKLVEDNLKLQQKVDILVETSYPDMDFKAFFKCLTRFLSEHPIQYILMSLLLIFLFSFLAPKLGIKLADLHLLILRSS